MINMLSQIKLTDALMPKMVSLWQSIFPKEKMFCGFGTDHMSCFEYSLHGENIGNHQYYLYQNGEGEYVGISGIYDEPGEKPCESAWLGWFGVVETQRRRGYGSCIINYFEKDAKKFGYKFCRIYTEDSPDNDAVKFYEKLGYTFEPYNGPVPLDSNVDKIKIGAKAIANRPLTRWNDRPIYFD